MNYNVGDKIRVTVTMDDGTVFTKTGVIDRIDSAGWVFTKDQHLLGAVNQDGVEVLEKAKPKVPTERLSVVKHKTDDGQMVVLIFPDRDELQWLGHTLDWGSYSWHSNGDIQELLDSGYWEVEK